jgi:hypothetical protein
MTSRVLLHLMTSRVKVQGSARLSKSLVLDNFCLVLLGLGLDNP